MRRPLFPGTAGQSTTEFLIVFPLLVLLVFGIIQFALLYQARATLNHATLLAARAGALHNGDRGRMRSALATGLAPLFAATPSPAGYVQALRKANQETAALSNMSRVEVLNPTRSAFTDFARDRLDGMAGRELPSDTLNYRNPAPGGASGLSVQDANILHVRVSYCFRLIVPVLDRLISAAASSASCINPRLRGPRIIIQSEAMVRMQSNFYESNL
jgi:Flp pilus assembly protein TadG